MDVGQHSKVEIISADTRVQTPPFLVLYLYVDTAEWWSQYTNTMLEGIIPEAEKLLNHQVWYEYFIQLCDWFIEARCLIDPTYLATDHISGKVVRNQIIVITN